MQECYKCGNAEMQERNRNTVRKAHCRNAGMQECRNAANAKRGDAGTQKSGAGAALTVVAERH